MARKLSTRKRPSREVHMQKEQKKVEDIFDKTTLIYLSSFFNKGVISKLEFKIATGKEADVYIADAGVSDQLKGSFVILKCFRIEDTSFPNMSDYIIGDPRFKRPGKSMSAIVKTWCRKEFGNLNIAVRAGVSAPAPYMFNGNILAIEFIGDESGAAAPRLKDIRVEEPKVTMDQIIENVRKFYAAGFVHADISEYNVLINNSKPWLIDFGQAVSLKHPNAERFIDRDIFNLSQYFWRRYGIKTEHEALLDYVKG